MPKRVAITIAGAVSLGSYEAGVLYELLEVIRLHNEEADRAGTQENKIYVDVLSGASAGGMTAAMVAQSLVFNGALLQGEFTNVLYDAWVQRISLMRLARMRRRESRSHSLFSSELIDEIGRALLVDSIKTIASMKARGGDNAPKPHPAVEMVEGKPAPLRLGLAVTNLNGINYKIPIAGTNHDNMEYFNYTSSADQKTFTIFPGDEGNQAKWKTLCAASVASGAFPAAFRPKALDHEPKEYESRGVKTLPTPPELPKLGNTYIDWPVPGPRPFAHTDGGVLQNQPLGIARDLVFEAVEEREQREGMAAHCDAEDRLYVFVAPHSVTSTAEQGLQAGSITISAILRQLVKVYMRQAMFHDWITAEGVNQDIRLLDTRAVQLAEAICEGRLDFNPLGTAAQQINQLLNDKPNHAVARLREQYSRLFNKVENEKGSDAALAFVTAVAVIEASAVLQENDKMKILAVIAREDELAGAGLAAFAGFFKRSFREHDYFVGRKKTREYLLRSDVKRILGVTVWPSEAIWAQEPLCDPSGVKLPVTGLQLALAGVGPAAWMIAIRPRLLAGLLAIASLAFGAWRLWHRF